MTDSLYLGLDLGTTKVAAVVVDGAGAVRALASQAHHAGRPAPPGRAEQDAEALLDAAWKVVCALPEALRQQARGVGVTGQMHGVALVDAHNQPVGPLITWQDRRALEAAGWLDALREATGHRLHSGYGLATLAWLHRHEQLPTEAVAAATIHDLAVARLCVLPRPVTDPSGAASWGGFDLEAEAWNAAAVVASGVPPSILPEVMPFGHVAGRIDGAMARRLGLPEGIPVRVALGDLQAALLASIQDPEADVALNLGTGGQAALLTTDGVERPAGAPWDVWPFPGGRRVLVAASLNGGVAWAWLVDTLAAWLRDLGLPPPPRDVLFDTLNTLGLEATHEWTVLPYFLGERHNPTLTAAIHDIDRDEASLGALARGLARAIVLHLRNMLPADALKNRRRLVGSGNALRRSPLLQHMAEAVFGLPLALADAREEAATGAALLGAGRCSGPGPGAF